MRYFQSRSGKFSPEKKNGKCISLWQVPSSECDFCTFQNRFTLSCLCTGSPETFIHQSRRPVGAWKKKMAVKLKAWGLFLTFKKIKRKMKWNALSPRQLSGVTIRKQCIHSGGAVSGKLEGMFNMTLAYVEKAGEWKKRQHVGQCQNDRMSHIEFIRLLPLSKVTPDWLRLHSLQGPSLYRTRTWAWYLVPLAREHWLTNLAGRTRWWKIWHFQE